MEDDPLEGNKDIQVNGRGLRDTDSLDQPLFMFIGIPVGHLEHFLPPHLHLLGEESVPSEDEVRKVSQKIYRSLKHIADFLGGTVRKKNPLLDHFFQSI